MDDHIGLADVVELTALERVFAYLGSQQELAKRIGVSPYAITKWKQKRVPAERVLDIERVCCGVVTRYDLRPDLYPRDHAA